jgi:hypothetical protein
VDIGAGSFAGADSQPLFCFDYSILRYDLIIQFDPGLAGAAKLLQQKTISPENTCANRLLKSYAQVHSQRGAQKSVAMN